MSRPSTKCSADTDGCVRTKKDRVRLRVYRRTAASEHRRSYAIASPYHAPIGHARNATKAARASGSVFRRPPYLVKRISRAREFSVCERRDTHDASQQPASTATSRAPDGIAPPKGEPVPRNLDSGASWLRYGSLPRKRCAHPARAVDRHRHSYCRDCRRAA